MNRRKTLLADALAFVGIRQLGSNTATAAVDPLMAANPAGPGHAQTDPVTTSAMPKSNNYAPVNPLLLSDPNKEGGYTATRAATDWPPIT
jgi:hypothetical protein